MIKLYKVIQIILHVTFSDVTAKFVTQRIFYFAIARKFNKKIFVYYCVNEYDQCATELVVSVFSKLLF